MKRNREETSLCIPKRPSNALTGVRYLTREIKSTMESGFVVEMDDTNALQWNVYIPTDLIQNNNEELARQLTSWSRKTGRDAAILLHIQFPSVYPKSVPFVRIIRPRFCFHTGHITIGGSICTPLLTPSGWQSMTPLALLQAVLVIWKEGNATVQMKSDEHCYNPFIDYHESEARDAFNRVAAHHGWV